MNSSDIKGIEIRILKRLVALLLVLSGLSFLLFKEPLPIIYGLLFGGSVSFLNFMLLRISISRSIHMGAGRIMPYMIGSYMVRYTITGIVLYIAIVAPYLDFVATTLAFFLIKIIIHVTNLLSFAKKDISI